MGAGSNVPAVVGALEQKGTAMPTREALMTRLRTERGGVAPVPVQALDELVDAVGDSALLLLDSTYDPNDTGHGLSGELFAVTPSMLITVTSQDHPTIEGVFGSPPGFPVSMVTTYRSLTDLTRLTVETLTYPDARDPRTITLSFSGGGTDVTFPHDPSRGDMRASIRAAVAVLASFGGSGTT
jgi:hypothetical protein